MCECDKKKHKLHSAYLFSKEVENHKNIAEESNQSLLYKEHNQIRTISVSCEKYQLKNN